MRHAFFAVLVLALLLRPALAVEAEGGLAIQPGTEVIFGIGNPDADFNLPSKEIIGYPQAADFLELYNGTYKELICTVLWDPDASEYAAFTSNVANIPVYRTALLDSSEPIGCDCFARAHLGCFQNQGYGGCIIGSYNQRDIGTLRTCSCSCSGGARHMLAACISGSDGIGTYKNFDNGGLTHFP